MNPDDKNRQYEELRIKTFDEATRALRSRGNGKFTAVSQLTGGEVEKKILSADPTRGGVELSCISTTGDGGTWSIRSWDPIEQYNIFNRPHIEYADLIFMQSTTPLIFCDLKKKEACECLFVKYEWEWYSHFITLYFDDGERQIKCTEYGSEWVCFPA